PTHNKVAPPALVARAQKPAAPVQQPKRRTAAEPTDQLPDIRHVIGHARTLPATPSHPEPQGLSATRCKRSTPRRMLVEPSPTAASGALACPAAGWAGSPA